jgi:hypothetical protein
MQADRGCPADSGRAAGDEHWSGADLAVHAWARFPSQPGNNSKHNGATQYRHQHAWREKSGTTLAL